MRRTLGVVALGGVLVLGAACSEEDAKGGKACGPQPAALAAADTTLPTGFTVPPGVTLTASAPAGPSQVASGYVDGDLATVWQAFQTALGTAPFSVTKKEKDAHDAEVDFAGSGTTGQVRLGELCQGRLSVKITARPA